MITQSDFLYILQHKQCLLNVLKYSEFMSHPFMQSHEFSNMSPHDSRTTILNHIKNSFKITNIVVHDKDTLTNYEVKDFAYFFNVWVHSIPTEENIKTILNALSDERYHRVNSPKIHISLPEPTFSIVSLFTNIETTSSPINGSDVGTVRFNVPRTMVEKGLVKKLLPEFHIVERQSPLAIYRKEPKPNDIIYTAIANIDDVINCADRLKEFRNRMKIYPSGKSLLLVQLSDRYINAEINDGLYLKIQKLDKLLGQ